MHLTQVYLTRARVFRTAEPPSEATRKSLRSQMLPILRMTTLGRKYYTYLTLTKGLLQPISSVCKAKPFPGLKYTSPPTLIIIIIIIIIIISLFYFIFLFFYFFIFLFFYFFYFVVYITIFSNFSFGCSISLWLFKWNAEAFCELWLGKWGKRCSTGVNQPLEPFNVFLKFPLTCFFSWWISHCPPYPPCEQVFSWRAQNV